MHLLPISVRDVILPLVPTGSLDASLSFQMQEDAAQQGSRLHAKIQKRLAQEHPDIQVEQHLQWTFERLEFNCLVRGRLDVLLPGADPPAAPILEEIKCTYQPQGLLRSLEADPAHPFAQQARMYAWILSQRQGAPLRCRLRIVSLLDESETLVEVPFDPQAFSAWVEAQVDGLHRAHLRALARAEERRRIGAALHFPFEHPRLGQEHLMDLVATELAADHRLLLQAPTGLGKTAAVLYPALEKALGENLRVFYLTPRNSQHAVAEAFMGRLQSAGHPLRSITLRAKERVCPQEEVHCHPEFCPRALGYYDRLQESGALERLQALGCADAAAIQEEAERHQLCPFELSLDAARNADVIIGDYNYALSPSATLVRFFGTPEADARNLLLVDEAHNLPSRAASWFSPALDLEVLEELKRRRKGRGLSLQLTRCIRLVAAHGGTHRRVEVDLGSFAVEELRIRKLLAKAANEGTPLAPGHPLVQLFRLWSEFCGVLRESGEAHLITWVPATGHGSAGRPAAGRPVTGRLQITCVDAAESLGERFRHLAGAVLFSATLKPFDYYRRLSGLPEKRTQAGEVGSPFPAEHRRVLVVPQISTLFRQREQSVPRIAQFLSRVLPLRFGNYVVFFPSFDFLEKTLAQVDLPGFQVRAQPRRASQGDLAEILHALQVERGMVLFAVQGGSLSEGVDLPGEALIGCVVVGPPLPPFDLERRLAKDYFERRYGQGEDYAYTFPAMAKAIQAAGRVIRGPEERGLLAFLDGRFLEPAYAQCFPGDWFREGPREAVSEAILADVQAFWGGS